MFKVGFAGAGNVGATAALYVAESNLADVALVDIADGLAAGKALDLAAAAPVRGFSGRVTGGTEWPLLEGSDVVVVTAGLARKPGMSRDDLLAKNAAIVRSIAEQVAAHAPDAVVIMVTNPLDAMCEAFRQASGFPAARVAGMAGVLDSARFSAFLALELGASPREVSAMVLGGHGDTMVPLVSSATVGGVPVAELLPAGKIKAVVKRTAGAGAEVVALLKTGSAFVSPGASAAEMALAVLRDEKRVVPAAARLSGEYGYDGVYLGVPVVLGRGGVERVIEMKLSKDEKAALDKSAEAVKGLFEAMKRLG